MRIYEDITRSLDHICSNVKRDFYIMSLVWIESFNLKLGEGNRLLRIWSVFYHVFKRIMSRYLTSEDIGIGILWKLRDGVSGLSCNMNGAYTMYICLKF